MFVFFSVFSPGCTCFEGPNDPACYENVFLEEGCLREGYAFPANLSASAIDFLHSLDLA